MVIRIDRREKKIEEIRKLHLEQYYNKKILDSNNFMNLGLNMYIKKNKNIKRDIYSVFHESEFNENIILHPQQAECIDLLFKNDNMILSAPTSFGKTYVAFEFICRNNFKNIVFVVPTIALMNEIIKKVKDKYGKEYNIVTNSFEDLEEKNIFVLVPERVDIELINKINEIDFLIFDEIYKLKRKMEEDDNKNDKRIISLNKGYFELVNKSKKTLLLGPFIKDIKFERTKLTNNIVKYFSDFSPVYNKINFEEQDKDLFTKSKFKNKEQKLVYFKSPNSIYKFCIKNIDELNDKNIINNSLTEWCDKYISTKWLPSIMLKNGIGIHHGSLPTFMRKYIENMYNGNSLKNILCTSTLLEGINTPTNELIIYDSDKLSAFEVNNLIGRVGRLGSFKTGNIYFFDKDLENCILGEEKYESIEIIAEDNKASEIEEVIYLLKDKKLLDDNQIRIINEINQKLNTYNKQVENLIQTDGFIMQEFLEFLNNIPKIIKEGKLLYDVKNNLSDLDKKYESIYRGNIIKIFMDIIPNSNKVINSINKGLNKKIKASVCVNKLLAKVPKNIYAKIQSQITKQSLNLSEEKLNLFIDYLFDLAFKYIKYDLSRIQKYYNFVFSDDYTDRDQEIVDFIRNDIITRFDMFNANNNKIVKILLDLAIPFSDATKIEKIIKINLEEERISTSKVIRSIEINIDKINNSKDIEEVTKDIIKMLLERKD